MEQITEQNLICIKATLVALREGQYTVYVFENADTGEPLMCTRQPNWDGKELDMFQTGYLSYKFIQAGRDCWYKADENQWFPYVFTANYFLDFVPITHTLNNGRVVESEKLMIT